MSRISEAELRLAKRLSIDAATGAIWRSLSERRSSALLLKGPAIARWLYDEGEPRSYVDIDLLVPLREVEHSEGALRELGYRKVVLYRDASPLAERHWFRDRDSSVVDLHVSLWGAEVDVDKQWSVVAESAELLPLAATEVPVPRTPVRACLLSLHAAKHGRNSSKPMEDLRRGLDRLDVGVWRAAHDVALELDAIEAFSAGLRLVPTGVELADRFGLPAPRTPELLLRADAARGRLLGIDSFLSQPGVVAKGRFLANRVVPTRAFMHELYPFARRSRLSMTLAYLLRPFDLLGKTLKTAPVWWTARRRAREDKGA